MIPIRRCSLVIDAVGASLRGRPLVCSVQFFLVGAATEGRPYKLFSAGAEFGLVNFLRH